MIVPPFPRLAGLVLAATIGLATPAARGAAAQFASGVSLVEVYATVADAQGHLVTGLSVDDFQVSEDDQLQTIAAFAAGDFPLAIAIGLDRSFSMTPEQLSAAKSAARTLVGALRGGDEVMIIAIGSQTEVVVPLPGDRAQVLGQLDRLERWGTTPLYDATLAALDAIQRATGRRALVLLSDGRDRYSRTSAAELIDRARRKDVLVYPVTFARSGATVFAELAAVTGGRSFVARERRQLESVLTAIARELRFQYLLGYTPARAPDPEPRWRSIHVNVRRPGLRVRARDGYVAD